ncbi:recombinase family protein, partial [Thermosynechococcus sp.]|uniref:recombinase family protein n=1 Tax=Thermosynechococcus sp. TaxID=2814275 RepID=UPI00391CD184
MAYAPLRKAGKFLSLPPNTLRKYADKGKINSIKNEARQRLYDVIKDSGSGLNFKRKGLQGLLVRLMHGDKLTTVVACRDRLCRFGFEVFPSMAEQNSGSIVVLAKPEHCPETELTADLLATLHVFSCRMHGLRSYRKKIKEDSSLP